MIEISKEILDKVLEPYKTECQYLIKAESDYPITKGIFKIPHSFYTKEGVNSGHFNATDMMICYNQLAFAFFIDSIQRNLIKEIEKNLSLERRFQEGLIIGMNNIKFKKSINPKEFGGNIEYGWMIWESPNLFIEAEFHAVWIDNKGEYIYSS